MAEYIGCRNCNSPDCKGCNLKNLETMLNSGKFDCLMNENRCINPTAYVTQVLHGRWEQCFEDWRKQVVGDKCSVCGFKHYGTSIGYYHYCPNCGAKMDARRHGR